MKINSCISGCSSKIKELSRSDANSKTSFAAGLGLLHWSNLEGELLTQ